MLKLVIIDDEIDARANIRSQIEMFAVNGISIAGEADNLKTGVSLIRSISPDVVLLDINLGDGDGFELLDHFQDFNFHVIFITAYDQFALKAFKYSAVDYLLKPIDPDQLRRSLEKIKINNQKDQLFHQQIGLLMENYRNDSNDRIALSTSNGINFLKITDIKYLHSDGNYTEFHCVDENMILVSKSLKEYEEILPDSLFCRIHQSYLVNINYVSKILKKDGDFAVLDNGALIPISRRKKEGFMSRMMGI